MINDYALQAETFVNFLNSEFSGNSKNTTESHFRLERLRPRFLFGIERQRIILNNMYSPANVSFYGNNIERVADVLYSKEKARHFSLAGFKTETWDKMQIDIVEPIELSSFRIIEPQILTLHHVSTREDNVIYLEQLRRLEQLAYENGSWRFAD